MVCFLILIIGYCLITALLWIGFPCPAPIYLHYRVVTRFKIFFFTPSLPQVIDWKSTRFMSKFNRQTYKIHHEVAKST